MAVSVPQPQVENVNGNCVIITTLTSSSSSAAPPSLVYHSQTSRPTTRSDTGFSCQWPLQLPQQHIRQEDGEEEGESLLRARQLSSSLPPTRMVSSAVQTDLLCPTSSPASHSDMAVDVLLDEYVKKGSAVMAPANTQGPLPVHPNVGLGSWTLKHVAHLGSLVVVKRPRGTSRAIGGPTGLSEVEKMSYQQEIDNLRGQLTRAEGMLVESRHQAEEKLLEKTELLEEARREDERCRRRQFQEALVTLRAENEELMGRVTGMEERAKLAATQVRDRIQSEWSDRFAASESQWRERLRSAQRQWEDYAEEQAQEKHEALQQVQELAHAVEELEATLRQVTREKSWIEHERDGLLAAQPRSGHRALEGSNAEADSEKTKSFVEAELVVLRRTLKDMQGREGALTMQLEVCGNEAAAREAELERELQDARQMLENERRRSADLVKLYGSQVETLYEQLNDAMRRNKHLTRELAKFQ